MTLSPSLRPLIISKYFSPAMPVLTSSNTALPSRTTKTPSSSLRSCPGFNSDAWTVVDEGRRPGVTGSRTICPLSSSTTSRTVVAWIGTASALARVAVVISAVQVKPGLTSGISPSICSVTLKLVAWVDAVPVA